MPGFKTFFNKLREYRETNIDNSNKSIEQTGTNKRITDREDQQLPHKIEIKKLNSQTGKSAKTLVFSTINTGDEFGAEIVGSSDNNKIITQEGSTTIGDDWQLLYHDDYENPGTQNTDEQHFGWSITFDKIDITLLPFMKIDVIFRELGDGQDGSELFVLGEFSKIFSVEDLGSADDNIKKVTLHIFVRETTKLRFSASDPDIIIGTEGLDLSYEAFISIIFPNPRIFI